MTKKTNMVHKEFHDALVAQRKMEKTLAESIVADNKRLRKNNVNLWRDNLRLRKVVAAAEVLIWCRPGNLSWDEAWADESYGEQILMILGKLELALKKLEGE